MTLFQSLKTFIKNTPKGVLAIGIIGVCSLLAAILLVLSTHTQTNAPPTTVSTDSSKLSHAQNADTAASSNVAGASTNTPTQTQPATSTDNKTASKTSDNNHSNNAASGNASNSTATPTAPTPAQPAPPKADYNLNETWYFATATTGGIYNTCWPTALTESNEAQCGDLDNAYSYPNSIFSGLGVSKSATTAQTLAANQAHEKALAQHVDPRLGGGYDAAALTEAVCSQYSLSCGRW